MGSRCCCIRGRYPSRSGSIVPRRSRRCGPPCSRTSPRNSFPAMRLPFHKLCGLLAFQVAAFAADLPEGFGLAGKYQRDDGLAKDPAVVLFENFESGEVADLSTRWSEISNHDGK